MTVTHRSFGERAHVTVTGAGPRTLLCAHGFCSHQGIFRHQVDAFQATHQVVTYDLAGFGQSDPELWNAARYATLDGYAAPAWASAGLGFSRTLRLSSAVRAKSPDDNGGGGLQCVIPHPVCRRSPEVASWRKASPGALQSLRAAERTANKQPDLHVRTVASGACR
ncbi:alpha/beta fold hydrolase [Deinococcus taeanensis]|uniref:alpha/beta fold hydrolase n=1 Tax=Deinococcus taeanensis TaxID=2737050 RepID=UPI003D818545